MKKIIFLLLIAFNVMYGDATMCNQHIVVADDAAKSAVDYAMERNHKYARIEVNLALEYTKYALDSCQGIISSYKMDELIKNISSLCETQKKIEERLPNLIEQVKSKYCKKDIIVSSSSEEDVAYFTTNPNKAMSSCEMGNGAACYALADKFFKSKDMRKAPEYFRKSCDNGYYYGCRRIGFMYLLARVVKKDTVKSAEYYKKGCDGNDAESCTSLGASYLTGRGVSKNKLKAKSLYKKACTLGDEYACLKVIP